MLNMKKWMLGAAVLAGAAGLGATQANAAQFGVYVGAPAAYVPPCPGPGYVWIAGYYANGYWVPGRWSLGGYRGRPLAGPVVRFDVHRDYGRHDFVRDRGHFRR